MRFRRRLRSITDNQQTLQMKSSAISSKSISNHPIQSATTHSISNFKPCKTKTKT